jgi:hypothetical protein
MYWSRRSGWGRVIKLHNRTNTGQLYGEVGEIGKYSEIACIEGLRVPAHTK